MTALPLITSIIHFVPLIYGNRRCRPAPQQSHHSGLVPTFGGSADKYFGHFVYQSTGSNPAKIVFVRVGDNLGMFSVECETACQSDWLPLYPDKDVINMFHTVPEGGPGSKERDDLVAKTRAACPRTNVLSGDFTDVLVDEDGNVRTVFGGAIVTLVRTWLPVIPGFYSTGDSSQFGLKMQYNVSMNGTAAVNLGCKDGADTGFNSFLLVGMGIGEQYELSPMKGGATLEDLVEDLKGACPGLPKDKLSARIYKTVGFATEVIYVTGNFILDSLRRQS
ncbi:hypothetical protein FOZ63_025697 [Perkinsus olseni]|uniref:Uncharacterized protein n=1 Tax=Perkinsus olseni TaxID=32597 RepID=A0A7J6UFY5_PEROL|nr:hypothetical protein FOZ63_025697 [Perkinsus olseni]KAF4756170.1 hypothetical protein FOZ62_014170 [Perkinsus olseni]